MFDLKTIVFILIFMIFEYILLITEWTPFLNIYSKINRYKFNWYKDKDNNFKYLLNILFSVGYVIMVYMLYYGVHSSKNLYISFIFVIFVVYCSWDFCTYLMFDVREKIDIFILCYDVLIVGCLCAFITVYIFNNYFNILKNYIPILVALYLFTMACFYYKSYKYNPDISNITFNKLV